VTATLALVLAIGGGSAWAVTHHYKITSLRQLKPSVVEQLESNSHAGTAGPQGATGPAGIPGTNGTTGPQGPGAIPLYASTTAGGNDSTAVGPIPVQLQCVQEGGEPEALLLANASGDNDGFATRETGSASADSSSLQSAQSNALYPTYPGTMTVGSNYVGSGLQAYADGSAVVYENAGAAMTSETITFELNVNGSGANGTCQLFGQLTPS
jgi:hypothetical protein